MLDKDSIAYYNLLFLKSRIKNKRNNKKKHENIEVIDTGRKITFNKEEEKKGDNEEVESEISIYVYE